MDEKDRDWKPGFRINHNDTVKDKAVVEGFKLYAKEQFDDVYVLALADLLETKDVDWKYDTLHQMMVELERRLSDLEAKSAEPKKKEGPRAFGEK